LSVQVIAWKDSSPIWPTVVCQARYSISVHSPLLVGAVDVLAAASSRLKSVVQGSLCTSYWALLFPVQWNSTGDQPETWQMCHREIFTDRNYVDVSLAASCTTDYW